MMFYLALLYCTIASGICSWSAPIQLRGLQECRSIGNYAAQPYRAFPVNLYGAVRVTQSKCSLTPDGPDVGP